MTQYCRYCRELCINNVPYCQAHNECLSESYCKRPNKCKDFDFADVEAEYQDAFGENDKGYRPRKPKEPIMTQCEGQINMFEPKAEGSE